tara:strand:+ start:224 stop:664 length:441 start_codon:yes stop_codon:yes gene_type:complete
MKFLKTKSYHQDEQKWFAVDASAKKLGRLAARVAIILQGKHKPHYTPHADLGDCVVVYNLQDIVCTSKDKIYYRHSGRMGSLKQRTFAEQMQISPESVFRLAVKRMLKNTPLGRDMLRKLKCYAGDHQHSAQQPKELVFNDSDIQA